MQASAMDDRMAPEWARWMSRLLTGLSGLTFIALCVSALGAGFWRRDTMMYTGFDQTWEKVLSEGRWLSVAGYPFLSPLPGHLMWVIGAACLWAGLYLILDRLLRWRSLSAAATSLALSAPPVFFQLQWPDVICLASVVFLIGALVLRPERWKWLPAFGVLLFASMPFLYYFLALTMLPRGPVDTKGFVLAVLRGVWWGLGLIAGYLVSALFNLMAFGHFGIQLAAWRAPRPAGSIGEGLIHLDRYLGQVRDYGEHMTLAPLLFGGLLLLLVLGDRYWRRRPATVILGAGFLSVVAATPILTIVPSGIHLSMRSLIPLTAGLSVLPLFLLSPRARPLGLLTVAVCVGVPSVLTAWNSNRWYAEITSTIREDVEGLSEKRPRSYDSILVDLRGYDGYFDEIAARATERYGWPYKMEAVWGTQQGEAAFAEAGYRRVVSCREDGAGPCKVIVGMANRPDFDGCPPGNRACHIGVVTQHNLLVAALPGTRFVAGKKDAGPQTTGTP